MDALELPVNEYTRLLDELRGDELYLALYTKTLRDEACLSDYGPRPNPVKPSRLFDEESRMFSSIEKKERSEQLEAKSKFYKWAHTEFKDYYVQRAEGEMKNASNIHFLRQMSEFLTERCPSLAAVANGLIAQHRGMA